MKSPTRLSRRRLLKTGTAVIAGTVSARATQTQANTNTIAETTKTTGLLPSELGSRSSFESIERGVGIRALSGISTTPLEKLSGIITPSDLHFERHHAGIPLIDPSNYKLLVHGLVKQPLKLTLEDLKRFPSESRICFLECSGNGYRTSLEAEQIPTDITVSELDGLFSVSEWTGVRLSTIFKEVGAKDKASWFLAEGQDGAVMTRSVPMYKAWDDAMIVYAQNGEPLRPAQGYPLRLLLPGWEGNMSVKWLRRLELGDAPFMTREETSKYSDAMGDGKVKMFSFTMAPKSLITSPTYPTVLETRGWREIRGLAWSGNGKIKEVEISTDGGKHWQLASLQSPILSKCASRFRYMWEWKGKPTTLMTRALDETGVRQATIAQSRQGRGPGTFYHNNAIRPWHIDADGRVTFALRDYL